MADPDIHAPSLRPAGQKCSECRAELATDQRYCLHCGERQSQPRVDPLAAGGHQDEQDTTIPAVLRPAPTPSLRVAALLSLAMLVTGIALGAAAGPNAQQTLASGSAGIIAVVAPPAAQTPVAAPVTPPLPAATTPPPAPVVPPVSTEPTTAAPTPVASTEPTTTTPSEDTTTTGAADSTTTPAAATPTDLPPVKHIWLVVLADQPYQELWGTTATPQYFAQQLRGQGTFLPRYYAVAHPALTNAIALISGQDPAKQVATAKSLPDQLTGAGLTWKAYIQDVVPTATPTSATCPAPQSARDPFVFFTSIANDAVCASSVVGLDQLTGDLADPQRTPAFSYIAPATGTPADLQPFVSDTIAKITATDAFKKDGLVIVTSDQAPADGPYADSRKGGGRTGALLISPFVTAGATITEPYDHFSLLRSIENLFGLDHLGLADIAAHKAFGPKVYAEYTPPSK